MPIETTSRGPGIHRLTGADLPACLKLAEDRGWPPEERKWAFLLRVGEAHGVIGPDGELAATGILTRYGRDRAVISMVLVAERHSRQGIGGRLMAHLIDAAQDATVTLYATRMGLPLYERLGFRRTGGVVPHVGRFPARQAGPPITRRARPADLEAIIELDAAAFGADRGTLLREVPGFVDRLVVTPVDGPITGYAAAWYTVDKWVIGPVLAGDRGTARRMITELAEGLDAPVRLDLDEQDTVLMAWAQELGLTEITRISFMVHGGRSSGSDPDRMLVPFMQALG